jgi:hypothetical protein
LDRSTLTVVSYAYAPTPAALARLGALLRSALGAEVVVNVREQVPYGDEQALLDSLDAHEAGRELFVLLLNLAATPEDENHGVLMAGLRDRLARGAYRAPLLVVIDEGPYAERMAAQGGAGERMSERRRTWETFARERDVALHFVNLLVPGRPSAGEAATADRDEVERLRSKLQSTGGLNT